jgi:iron(III) transport system permease protein
MKAWRVVLMLWLVLLFVLFMAVPLYTVLARGLGPGLLAEALASPFYRQGLLNAFAIALCTTGLVFLIAVPAAVLFDRYDFPGKALVNGLMMIPMILPPFVGALGFQQLFGHYGVVNTLARGLGLGPVDWLGGEGRFFAVCVIEALHLYPILYLNAVTALANVEPALEEAARNLGAGRWRRFVRVTLPLIRPGLFAGGSLVLIWSFTELGTPLMLGYTTVTPVQIFNGVTELESNPMPYALVALLLLLSVGLYAASRRVLHLGGGDAAPLAKGTAGRGAVPLKGLRGRLALGVFGAITLAAGLPHLALLASAFALDWYGTALPGAWTLLHFKGALSHELVAPSILNSLKYASLAAVICMVTGVPAALLLARWKSRWTPVFDLMIMAPLAVPGLVIAVGYLGMCARYPGLNRVFDPVANPTLLLAAAYAIRRLPYVVRAVVAGLEQTPVVLEEAARNLGAGRWLTLRRVTLPLIAANVVVGALFAFGFSMLEVSDSLILAQRAAHYPITKAIFELSQVLGQGSAMACAFGVWAMLFLAFTLGAAAVLLGRKLGALFRV